MANKDHTLDEPILHAAYQEFLANGYEKASLRKIAAAANVTVGAIYTRYKTKDSLFCALVAPLTERIGQVFSTLKADYAGDSPDQIDSLSASMARESQMILHLLFDDYDRAVLLLCRSGGSSLENFFDRIVQRKLRETVAFFSTSGGPRPSEEILRMLINAQFHMYYQIIAQACSPEDARELMNAAIIYTTGGWLALLEAQNNQENGGTTK